ncbi:hypothetical protein [Mesorhizobium sp. CAU 1732]|uniref:hypothetical protein n=1 Tax=Mesorhizobium sp. CAU 1732 TaxID=3140358 RepID=UPI00326103EA
MDWKRGMDEERVALGRLVALLCALAGLAELAAGRSPIVRGLVLLFLRQAEAVARDVVDGGPDTPAASMPIGPVGFSPADALRLAASLRALAKLLDRQARLIVGYCREGAGRAKLPGLRPMPAIRHLQGGLSAIVASGLGRPRRVIAPDTS